MAAGANGNQILFCVVSTLAPEVQMVNLQHFSPAAMLTSPPVAVQHAAPQRTVSLGIKLKPRLFWELQVAPL